MHTNSTFKVKSNKDKYGGARASTSFGVEKSLGKAVEEHIVPRMKLMHAQQLGTMIFREVGFEEVELERGRGYRLDVVILSNEDYTKLKRKAYLYDRERKAKRQATKTAKS